MRFIDAHHHLWDLEKHVYPWLSKPVDHIAGEYDAIRKSYLIGDFLADAGGEELVKSVHVEAAFDPAGDPVEETAWLQSLADDPASRGIPHAIVAFADLAAADVEETLARHRAHANMRGIRYMLNHGPEPKLCFAPRGDLMGDSAWRAGLALLPRYGLSFDLQIWPWQMVEAAALARDFPNLQFILNHAGMPHGQGPEAFERWRRGMAKLAEAPNIAVKISGLGMLHHGATAEAIRPFVLETLEAFGAGRCMFASNFPVDKLRGAYGDLWAAYRAATADLSDDERRRLFHDTAARVYRI